MSQDDSARRRAERLEDALRRSQERLRMLMEQSPFAIQIFAMDGTLVQVNRAWEQMWNANGEAVVGSFNPLRDPQVVERGLYDVLVRVFEGEVVVVPDVEYDPAQSGLPGESRWVRTHFYHLRDEQGALQNVVVLNEDVTAHHRAEEERAMLQAQLQQAQKMEAIGRLAGGVAHDFNNLLTAILGYVELAFIKLQSGAPIREDLEEVRAAGGQAAALVHQLLVFSRDEPDEPEIVDLGELLTAELRLIRRILGEDVRISMTADDDLWKVQVAPHQIGQILMNLASNARDAMPRGGRLNIEARNMVVDEAYTTKRPEAKAGEHIQLVVSDDGAGMDQKTILRAFEPFFTTKPVGEGTGLGLATVYGVVQQHHGWIELESTPGAGTTFRIYLPRVFGELSPIVGAVPAARGSETILLVEDEPAVRTLAARLMMQLGYNVLVAEGGAEALRIHAAEGSVDLLLTDVVMPEMNGLELHERVAARQPGLSTVIMSGYPDRVLEQYGDIPANVGFLAKPFTTGELARMLRRTLSASANVDG